MQCSADFIYDCIPWTSREIYFNLCINTHSLSNRNNSHSRHMSTVINTDIKKNLVHSNLNVYVCMTVNVCVLVCVCLVGVLCSLSCVYFVLSSKCGRRGTWLLGQGEQRVSNSELIVVIILCSILGPPTFPRSTWPPSPFSLSPIAPAQVLAVGQGGLRVRGSQLCKCFQLLCDWNWVLLFDQTPRQARPRLFLAAAGDERMSAWL